MDAIALASSLPGFRGDIGWIHRQEGHYGKGAYWPKGASGVTLDPGLDLGYVDWALFQRAYRGLLSPAQMEACERVRGVRGRAALAAIAREPALSTIRLTRAQATAVFPLLLEPYWRATTRRFPGLLAPATPAAAHTALLSLAFNRGPHNPDLKQLEPLVAAGRWADVADAIEAMQDDHVLEGIRRRRDREAQYIEQELALIAEQTSCVRAGLCAAAGLLRVPILPPQI